jgi:putative ABC transport system substrate-binding protein
MKRRELIHLLGGAMTTWPLTAHAQQTAMPVIGYLIGPSPGPSAPGLAAFHKGLRETGYVEGQNLTIEYRWADGHYDRLPTLADELVRRKVDVMVTRGGTTAALAAKHATSTIPIIFEMGSDPVADGLVASLARPGGNLTGVSLLVVELMAKRVELLRELVPRAGVIALLVNPNNVNIERVIRDVQDATVTKGIQLHILMAGREGEIDGAFESLVQRSTRALLVATDPFIDSQRERLVALAARHSVPAIYGFREFVAAGGLISYGPSLMDVFRQQGIYAGKILKGAKPAELPVVQPTTFELVINLNTAKVLGITIPPALLARADEVVE